MNSESIKPTIDDAYWFKLSEDMVSKAPEIREQAAIKLQNLVVWLWGVYTAYAAIGIPLAGKALSFEAKVMIVAASVALIGVYWVTVWVQMPISVEFDPRSPTQIMKAYAEVANEKNKRLHKALFLSLIAAMMVTAALVAASVIKEQKPAAPKFSASVCLQNGTRILAVTGIVGQTPKVKVILQSLASKTEIIKPRAHIFIPTEDGTLQTSIPLDGMVEPLSVSLEWEDPTGTKVCLSREVHKRAKD